MFTKKNLIALFMGVCCLSVANAEESNFKFSGFANTVLPKSIEKTNTAANDIFFIFPTPLCDVNIFILIILFC